MWWTDLPAAPAAAADDSDPQGLLLDPTAEVAPSATFDTSEGPISIGARSRICPGAYLKGPVSIGADCLVGNMAIIRGRTLIAEGTRIGFATEIKNARIGARVTIGPQCFVADSIVEREAYLGAQVRTSNHRLDKRNVEVIVDGRRVDTGLDKLGCLIGARAALGIQVVVLPGREIAPDAVFAPRITIEKNLPTGRYRLAQNLEQY